MPEILSFGETDIAAVGTYIPEVISIVPASKVSSGTYTSLNQIIAGGVDLKPYLANAEVYEITNARKITQLMGVIGTKEIINIPGDAKAVFPANMRDYFFMALQKGMNPWATESVKIRFFMNQSPAPPIPSFTDSITIVQKRLDHGTTLRFTISETFMPTYDPRNFASQYTSAINALTDPNAPTATLVGGTSTVNITAAAGYEIVDVIAASNNELVALEKESSTTKSRIQTGTAHVNTSHPTTADGTLSTVASHDFKGAEFTIVIKLIGDDAGSNSLGTAYMIMPKVAENSEAQNLSLNTGENSTNLSFLALNLMEEEMAAWKNILSLQDGSDLLVKWGQFYMIHVKPDPV